jgi:hypothetical protein
MSAHAHSFDGRWPFAEPDNTAAFCCEHVFARERPILRVSHDHDGDWQFLCGDSHAGGQPKLICMGCVLERDGTLVAVADLPLGWGADRQVPGAPWVREENPLPEEDDDEDDA